MICVANSMSSVCRAIDRFVDGNGVLAIGGKSCRRVSSGVTGLRVVNVMSVAAWSCEIAILSCLTSGGKLPNLRLEIFLTVFVVKSVKSRILGT
ncbi:hypothetical protein KOR42_09960 [Thalassoglobus neptunius]|uniref:Uncharacterized protein n=1 Tax=Thalassoglobus neptunius TaxID=1938619 RepID=A0A5C5X3M7_9PLAN|nr:hypothetical protein KOR42_09960 [Thalassoglobus neptunius]